MVAQLCKYTKNYWIVHLKWVKFLLCKLYLNKAVFLKKNTWSKYEKMLRMSSLAVWNAGFCYICNFLYYLMFLKNRKLRHHKFLSPNFKWNRYTNLKPFLFFFFFNVYLLFLRERKRQSMSGGGTERGRHTELEAGSRLRAVSIEPDMGLEPMNCEIMTWAKVRHLTNWTTQAPLKSFHYTLTRRYWQLPSAPKEMTGYLSEHSQWNLPVIHSKQNSSVPGS